MCTLQRAKLALTVVFVLITIASLMNFLYYDVVPCDMMPGDRPCRGYWLKKSHFVTDGGFYNTTFFVVLAIFYGLLPLIIFIFLCIGMIISLVKLSRDRQRHTHYDVHFDFYKKTVGLYVLLLLFMTTLLPQVVFEFILSDKRNKNTQFFFFMTKMTKARLVSLVQLLIASIDILVYIPISRGFRRELKRLFHCVDDAQEETNEEDIGPNVMWPKEAAPLFE